MDPKIVPKSNCSSANLKFPVGSLTYINVFKDESRGLYPEMIKSESASLSKSEKQIAVPFSAAIS